MDDDRWVYAVDGATVHFMAGASDDAATVENIDAHVHRSDGRRYSATFLTLSEIDRILARWRESGEVGGGRYFWCADLIVVPAPGVPAMLVAVKEMIQNGDIDAMLSELAMPMPMPMARRCVGWS